MRIALGLTLASLVTAEDGCYKNTTTRGAGHPLSACIDGYEKNGLLCYPICRDGYDGVGPVCWEQCKPGYTDIGAFCQPKQKWGDNSDCPVLDKCGLITAKGCVKCPEGFTAKGCICENGSAYAKDTYTRPSRSMVCDPEYVQSGALCYPPCQEPSFAGHGPVCWQPCSGDTPFTCGAVCTPSAEDCKGFVLTVAEAVFSLVETIAICALAGPPLNASLVTVDNFARELITSDSSTSKRVGQVLSEHLQLAHDSKAARSFRPERLGRPRHSERPHGRPLRPGHPHGRPLRPFRGGLNRFRDEDVLRCDVVTLIQELKNLMTTLALPICPQ